MASSEPTSPSSGDTPERTAPYSPFARDLLDGARVLVSGGGTGIGKAIATGLAMAGADLVIAARREDVLADAAEEIRALSGRSVEAIPVDIRDRGTVEALAGKAGTIDILVNNAGGQFPQKARDYSPNGFRTVIDLNLNGTWNMTQVFGEQMLSGDGGVICQVIAIVGRGLPGIAHTAAARSGVLELTRSLAYEWGPSVRLNCVAPGAVITDGWKATYDESIQFNMGGVPIPRPGSPEDIANAVTFLVSPAARFITGEVVYVDGGHILQGSISAIPSEQYTERSGESPRTDRSKDAS